MKILIIKLSAIGDVIMATTMLEAIKEKYGECEITWVCGNSVYPILRYYPIQHLLPIDESKLLIGNTIVKTMMVLSLWKKLFDKTFDLIVTAHSDKKYSILTLPIKSKKKVFFNQLHGRKVPIPGRYHGDEYARLITDYDNHTMKHWYPMVLPNLVPYSIKEFNQTNKKIVVLAPGGAKNTMRDDSCRRWPIEQYVKLARLLISAGFMVAITGAVSDAWVEPYFSKISIVDFIGKTSLIDTLNIFSQANLVVTHNSGPLHLAILVRSRVLGIFGPTMPCEKIPHSSNVHILWNINNLPCCPCYDGKNYADCKYNQCLHEITAEYVLEKVMEMESEYNK